MSDPTPKPPLAVRLARIAYPGDIAWRPVIKDTKPWPGRVANYGLNGDQAFFLDSLDDLHRVEVLICEAVNSSDPLEDALEATCRKDAGCNADINYSRCTFAPAAQRAAAIEALLDQEPELEKRLTEGV